MSAHSVVGWAIYLLPSVHMVFLEFSFQGSWIVFADQICWRGIARLWGVGYVCVLLRLWLQCREV